jgi:5-formyltetrahydrofolate cyclo-ligase
MDKSDWRQELRKRRRAVSVDERLSAAAQAAARIGALPGWSSARTIAGYMASAEEFDCGPLLRTARAAGKRLALPAIEECTQLQFRCLDSWDALETGPYGIAQPPEQAEAISVNALDVLLVPLVGFTRQGVRLGMGGGYYDRVLASERPGLLVGVGFDCQECDSLKADRWDVPLDYVLTESRLLRCEAADELIPE